VESGLTGAELNGPAHVLDGLLVLAALAVHDAKQVEGVGIARLLPEQRPVSLPGGLQVAGLVMLESLLERNDGIPPVRENRSTRLASLAWRADCSTLGGGVTGTAIMQTIQTAYFGPVSHSETSVIRFERGLPGFEQERSFITIGAEGCSPLVFLQSVATPGLCFVTLPVLAVAPDYRLDLQPEDLAALGLPSDSQPQIGDDLLCLGMVSINEGEPPTANLLAPVVIDLASQRGVQALQPDAGRPLRHPLTAKAGAAA